MRRREFITLLGGAAARASTARRCGSMGQAEDDPEAQARVAAFAQGLQQLGWSDGRNVRIDRRWAAGDADRTRRYAAELIALAPDVILAPGSFTIGPLRQVSRSVPIVFVHVPDPVGAGFVDSLARPGGNATGFILFRIRHEREMAGAAQGDCAWLDASSSHSRSRPDLRNGHGFFEWKAIKRQKAKQPAMPGSGSSIRTHPGYRIVLRPGLAIGRNTAAATA